MRKIKGIKPGDLQTENFIRAFIAARTLRLDDMDLDALEAIQFRERLIYVVARIAAQHGGPGLEKFRLKLQETEPRTSMKKDVEKSEIFCLPLFPIDESSNTGNAEVIEATFDELRLNLDEKKFSETLKFVSGDQLSIARLRSVAAVRAGNEGDGHSFVWLVKVPGLFHYKMNATTLTLVTHAGLPNHDLTNPASLIAHNTLLHRKAITASSPPNFRTSRNLINVSLYARVLHCLLRVSGWASLDEYGKHATWEDLLSNAGEVVDQYASTMVVDDLRAERANGNDEGGDMLFENAVFIHARLTHTP